MSCDIEPKRFRRKRNRKSEEREIQILNRKGKRKDVALYSQIQNSGENLKARFLSISEGCQLVRKWAITAFFLLETFTAYFMDISTILLNILLSSRVLDYDCKSHSSFPIGLRDLAEVLKSPVFIHRLIIKNAASIFFNICQKML